MKCISLIIFQILDSRFLICSGCRMRQENSCRKASCKTQDKHAYFFELCFGRAMFSPRGINKFKSLKREEILELLNLQPSSISIHHTDTATEHLWLVKKSYGPPLSSLRRNIYIFFTDLGGFLVLLAAIWALL